MNIRKKSWGTNSPQGQQASFFCPVILVRVASLRIMMVRRRMRVSLQTTA